MPLPGETGPQRDDSLSGCLLASPPPQAESLSSLKNGPAGHTQIAGCALYKKKGRGARIQVKKLRKRRRMTRLEFTGLLYNPVVEVWTVRMMRCSPTVPVGE